jgi:hypothetical protein
MTGDARRRRCSPRSLPRWLRRSYLWLIRPEKKWLRMPVGCLFIAGGLFGFLPVLGFWMLPLGLLLIGRDIPVIRRRVLQLLRYLARCCDAQDAGKDG